MKLLIILGLGYAGVAGLLYFAQTWLLFPAAGRPSQRLDHPAPPERLVLPSGDGAAELHGMLFRPSAAGADLLIGFGGNAQDAEFLAQDLAADFPDLQVAVFHYRGYGPSTGKPSEAALLADALTIYDALTERLRPPRTFAIGISLGSAVAAYLSQGRPLAGLILITPFDSVAAIAKESLFLAAGRPAAAPPLRDRRVHGRQPDAGRGDRGRARPDRAARNGRRPWSSGWRTWCSTGCSTTPRTTRIYQLPTYRATLAAAFAALRDAADSDPAAQDEPSIGARMPLRRKRR